MKPLTLVFLILSVILLTACSPALDSATPASLEKPPDTPLVTVQTTPSPSLLPSPTAVPSTSPPTSPTAVSTTLPTSAIPSSPALPAPPPTPPPALAPLDAFMKGISFNDWKDQIPGFYGPGTKISLEDLVTTGANWISVVVCGQQETVSSTKILRDSYYTATDAELLRLIQLAHGMGIRVALVPGILISKDPEHSWVQIGNFFTAEKQWQDWFTSYQEFINHYASFSQESAVDLLYIGTELPGTTQREADWRQVIKGVRERYKGPVSYDSVQWGFSINEYWQIKWWDDLDFIATDFWRSLTDKNDPTVAELKYGWNKTGFVSDMEKISNQYKKPVILSEIGYDSLDGTNKNYQATNKDPNAKEDLQEQADCYQAAMEVLSYKPWLKGIFWFQWSAVGMPWKCTPQNKPAEEVLKKFYLE